MTEFSIGQRLELVRGRVVAASLRVGRDPSDVSLIAVSKTQSADAIREAYEAGQRDFGENYVQELVAKANSLKDLVDIRWHLIGHLQSNKVKHVVGLVSVIHSVDRVRLVHELGRRGDVGCGLDVLVEVNVDGEDSKTGASMDDALGVVNSVRECDGLRLRGLMTVPPFDLDVREVVVHFERLRLMAEGFGLRELSMGMSHDFEEAIGCGATMIRVGTLIFGSR
ncbi:MAG: YggS family pyridoxal phosphate-dependent enzyme [Polyangiaceae bacterium]|nr:YggS family pyridoxal phosphate-dependent enzyme [Polyangiaceae bacterium]